jgi:hypothetical protein
MAAVNTGETLIPSFPCTTKALVGKALPGTTCTAHIITCTRTLPVVAPNFYFTMLFINLRERTAGAIPGTKPASNSNELLRKKFQESIL